MPSICGFLHRQQKNADPAVLEAAAKRLPSCGVESERFISGPVGFSGVVCCFGSLTIVADVRLDNRSDLLDRLTLADPKSSDPELIFAAYRKWGTHCPEYLLGDFSFVLWDESKQRLFCARDHFGVRPFYYTLKSQFFGFSSEIKGLLEFPDVSDGINEERIADYLTSVVADDHSTFYADILHLPAGHSITVEADSHTLTRFYGFQPSPVQYKNDQEYADHFHDLFEASVACRIQGKKNGFLLSGGLDSSSIACMAERLYRKGNRGAVAVYSGIFDTVQECDEQEYINAVLGHGNFNWHSIHADEQDLFGVLPEMAACQDEPWFAPHMFMMWNLLALMRGHGVTTLLDGHDGDTTVSHGWNYINNLIDDWRFPTLFHEARHLSRVHGQNCSMDMLRRVYLRKMRTPVAGTMLGTWFRWAKKRMVKGGGLVEDELLLLAPDFRKSTDADGRFTEFLSRYGQSNLREEEQHLQNVFQPIQPFALEVLGRSARHFGMEYHCPFWDKRIVEFCLNIPPDQKLQKGLSRSILRRGMQGILPEKVQLRPGKIDFTANLSHSFKKGNGKVIQNLLATSLPVVEKWVDKQIVSNYYRNDNDVLPQHILSIWKVITLAAWVQARGI